MSTCRCSARWLTPVLSYGAEVWGMQLAVKATTAAAAQAALQTSCVLPSSATS